LRLFSFGGYGLALAALALVVFGAYDSYPKMSLKSLFRDEILLAVLWMVERGWNRRGGKYNL